MDCSQSQEDLQPVLSEEVEIAVAALKKEKTARVDNIPVELLEAGREAMIDVLTETRNMQIPSSSVKLCNTGQ